MTMNEISLIVDETGVWRSDDGGDPFGIKWSEICGISGYTIVYDRGPEVEIEFDFNFGESFRINQTWKGFDEVVSELDRRRMYVDASWYKNLQNVRDDDEIYEVWRKS